MEQQVKIEILDEVARADIVTDWIVGKLFEKEGDAPEESPRPAPLLVARLSDLLGNGQRDEPLLEVVPRLFADLPEAHHGNALLYCSGYPMNAIQALADGDISVTVELLERAALPYRVEVERTRRHHEERQPTVITVATKQALAGRAVREFVQPIDEKDDDWRDDALCAQTDPEAFFPEKGGSTRSAKKICSSCDVRDECLEYALENEERFGIWGGKSERERRKLLPLKVTS